MIQFIEHLLKSRVFMWVRIGQFILAISIFTFAALMPSTYVPAGPSDHTLHLVGNALLFLSACVALLGRMKIGILVLFLVPYSLAIEAGQWFAPGRQVDIRDVAANIFGLALGYAIAHTAERVWQKIRDRRQFSLK